MDLRKLHLRNLRALYEDRQSLNLQARLCSRACSSAVPYSAMTFPASARSACRNFVVARLQLLAGIPATSWRDGWESHWGHARCFSAWVLR